MKKTLFFVALMATTLMACNKYNYNATNISGEWDLVEMNGQTIELAEGITTPFIGFDQDEARIYGNAGCNSFFGTMRTDSTKTDLNSIDFDNMGNTRMLCANMELEDEFLMTLGLVYNLEYNSEELLLKNNVNRVILRFVKKQ